MSTPDRAMRALTDAGQVRRALAERRVMHRRNDTRTRRASMMYEELRLFGDEELRAHCEMLGYPTGARAVMIAQLIEHALNVAEATEGQGEK